MKSVSPHRPHRILALLGFFIVAATLGFAGEKRVWVQYQAGAKGPVMAALAQANGRVHHEFDNLGAVAVSLPEQALNGISRNPHVVLVEDDPIRMMASETVPYGVPMVQAYPALGGGATGAGIRIGVIDSGVEAHPDLPGGKISGWPTTGPDQWNRDPFSHGTHVVGTIAAVGNNGLGVIGVAPEVGSIYMVKVFGDAGNWVNSSSLLAAVNNAVAAGSKIISMSLSGDVQSQTEKKGMDQLYNNQNILLVAASGNDGNTRTAYPAGYASVIAVAAIDSNKGVADFSQKNSAVELSAPGVAVLSTTTFIDSSSVTAGGNTYSGHTVEFAARGSASGLLVNGGLATSTNPGAWSGNVVLVERGTNSFFEKVMNVQSSGGVACIIYNNVAGEELFGTLGDGNTSAIPAIGLTQAQGQALLSAGGTTATVDSTFSYPAPSYQAWDGTSMATPHVSAVAALVWSKYPTATNKQVRQAMTETAEDLGTAGRDNSYGFGLVRANNALTRLQQLVGGGGGDTTAPTIGGLTTAKAKGKAGSFTVSFTTNEPATGTVSVTGLGSATTALGTSHSVKVQGNAGTPYSGTVTATDPSGNTSAPVGWSFTP
jgi:serine protease